MRDLSRAARVNEPRLLVIVPTLGRPQRVRSLLDSLASCGDSRLDLVFVATEGDRDELSAIRRARADYLTLPPRLESWARKVNLAFRERVLPGGYEWALLAADDVAFHSGWYDAVLAAHARSDACVVGTNDGHNKLVLRGLHSTHPCVNRDYWSCGTIDEPNLVIHEGYRHWFCDTELVETARTRGTYAHAHDAFVEHFHPLYRGAEDDETYRLGQSFVQQDRKLFLSRRHLWSGGRKPRPVVSS